MGRRRRSGSGKRGDTPDLLASLYPTLDLHGLSADEAEASTRRWLRERRRAGELTVRVITGRGLHSVGLAVLPGVIETLLDTLREEVATFTAEPGGGVYRVRLRPLITDRSGVREPVSNLSRYDPALVHEAQEALAELGVQPTPALIEAEIQRILEHR